MQWRPPHRPAFFAPARARGICALRRPSHEPNQAQPSRTKPNPTQPNRPEPLPPPPRSQVFDELEEVFYCRKGYQIPARERKLVDSTGGSATYGEALPEGVDALRALLELGPDDVLYDLGSGTGRVVLQLGLTSAAGRLVGVELSPTRHEHAEAAAEALRRRGLRTAPMDFRCEDIAAADISDGTYFYMCSTAFSAAICRRVAERVAAAPRFRALVTSRALPAQPHLQKLGELRSAYSWNLQGRAFVYVKSLEEAPPRLLSKFCSGDGLAWLPAQPSVAAARRQQQPGGGGGGAAALLRIPVDEAAEASWPGERVPPLQVPALRELLQCPGQQGAGASAGSSSSS
jgi:SAM-dependent methyltransferase